MVVAGVFLPVILTSCGKAGLSMFEPPKVHNPNELKYEDIPDELAMGADALGASGASGRFETTFSEQDIQSIEGRIQWAPLDPEVPFDLGRKGVQSKKYETWTKNYKKAIENARQTGKPLLIWFSDSKGSVISNRLSDELFSRGDFDEWVRGKFSTLLVDKAIDTSKTSKKRIVKLKKYHEEMAERFSVQGTPEVLVVNVKGEVYARYRGYTKGETEFYWGRLKVAHENAMRAYGSWRESMEKRGYRMWHSIDTQKKVFAKMIGADDEKVALVTPEGKRYKEMISRFSILDQNWVKKNRK